MIYRALTDFAGAVTMTEGEVREIADAAAAELIRAGYIAPAGEPQDAQEVNNDSITDNPRRRKKAAKDRL